MKNDRLLILFIVLVAGAVYLRVTHYQPSRDLFHTWDAAPSVPNGQTVYGSTENYPDVIARLSFDTIPADTLISAINACKSRYALRHRAWISELALDSATGTYMLASDYQATPYEHRLIQELTDSLYAISGQHLEYIQYE